MKSLIPLLLVAIPLFLSTSAWSKDEVYGPHPLAPDFDQQMFDLTKDMSREERYALRTYLLTSRQHFRNHGYGGLLSMNRAVDNARAGMGLNYDLKKDLDENLSRSLYRSKSLTALQFMRKIVDTTDALTPGAESFKKKALKFLTDQLSLNGIQDHDRYERRMNDLHKNRSDQTDAASQSVDVILSRFFKLVRDPENKDAQHMVDVFLQEMGGVDPRLDKTELRTAAPDVTALLDLIENQAGTAEELEQVKAAISKLQTLVKEGKSLTVNLANVNIEERKVVVPNLEKAFEDIAEIEAFELAVATTYNVARTLLYFIPPGDSRILGGSIDLLFKITTSITSFFKSVRTPGMDLSQASFHLSSTMLNIVDSLFRFASLFDSSPRFEDIVIEALNDIKKSLQIIHQYMEQRFDILDHRMIRLSEQLAAIQEFQIENFRQIRVKLDSIHFDLEQIEQTLVDYIRKDRRNDIDQNISDVMNLIGDSERLSSAGVRDVERTVEKISLKVEYFDPLRRAFNQSHEAFYANTSEKPESQTELLQSLMTYNLDQNLPFLAKMLEVSGDIPNPFVWSQASLAYLRMLKAHGHRVDAPPPATQIRDLRAMIQKGQRINSLLKNIGENNALFESQISSYENSIEHLLKTIETQKSAYLGTQDSKDVNFQKSIWEQNADTDRSSTMQPCVKTNMTDDMLDRYTLPLPWATPPGRPHALLRAADSMGFGEYKYCYSLHFAGGHPVVFDYDGKPYYKGQVKNMVMTIYYFFEFGNKSEELQGKTAYLRAYSVPSHELFYYGQFRHQGNVIYGAPEAQAITRRAQELSAAAIKGPDPNNPKKELRYPNYDQLANLFWRGETYGPNRFKTFSHQFRIAGHQARAGVDIKNISDVWTSDQSRLTFSRMNLSISPVSPQTLIPILRSELHRLYASSHHSIIDHAAVKAALLRAQTTFESLKAFTSIGRAHLSLEVPDIQMLLTGRESLSPHLPHLWSFNNPNQLYRRATERRKRLVYRTDLPFHPRNINEFPIYIHDRISRFRAALKQTEVLVVEHSAEDLRVDLTLKILKAGLASFEEKNRKKVKAGRYY